MPQLYSNLAASQELRKMLNIGRTETASPKLGMAQQRLKNRLVNRSDVSRLSDAELIAQLSDTAKELGIEINLNYSFAQQTICHRHR